MNTTGFEQRLASEPYPSSPGYWPIAAAARCAGMSARLLVAGIERGEIPAVLRRLGASGKRFVNAEQLQAWINQKPAAAADENLFEGITK